MAVLLEKELCMPGTFHTPTGVEVVDAARLRHWHREGRRMLRKGLWIPVPWEHQEDAEPRSWAEHLANRALFNAGFVHSYFLADGGLWAVLRFPDRKTARQAKHFVRFVSLEFNREWTDGDGELWLDVITHVALTPAPINYRQRPFGSKPRRCSARLIPGP